MLVVLYFHQLGYTPLAIASLFLFYEFFGIVTNLVGGWLGARIGLNATMHIGMALQVVALGMLPVDPSWLSIPYVMAAQALSGIAKDLNKMSAKASVKLMLPKDAKNTLFKWVTVLTGSKNTLKGAGFFIGALLLSVAGFSGALMILAGTLLAVLVITWILLPGEIGKTAAKPKFSTILSKSPAVNWLSAARFFLFGARDIWFVVALPVFLSTLGWSSTEIGSFIALWIIGYGIVQASSPKLLQHGRRQADRNRALGMGLSNIRDYELPVVVMRLSTDHLADLVWSALSTATGVGMQRGRCGCLVPTGIDSNEIKTPTSHDPARVDECAAAQFDPLNPALQLLPRDSHQDRAAGVSPNAPGRDRCRGSAIRKLLCRVAR